jgi:hypothetical protein
MRRRLFNLLTAGSLVMCVALTAAMVWSVVRPVQWNRMTVDERLMTTGQDAIASTSGFAQY